MNNLQRLQMETKGVELEQDEYIIYLMENDLEPHTKYDTDSATSRKRIFQSALSILESIANNPTKFASKRHEDLSITEFANSIQNRINQLERKIRTLKTDEQVKNESSFFMLFDR